MLMKKQTEQTEEQLFQEELPLMYNGRIVCCSHISDDNGETSAFLAQNPTTDEIKARFLKDGMYNSDGGKEIDDTKYDAERLLRSTTVTMFETDKLKNMSNELDASL